MSAITANDLRTRLYQIADDSMMGRRIGEPGNFKTTTYIALEFKRLGLKPAGDNGTWFQELPYGTAGFDSSSSRFLIAGSTITAKSEWIPVTPSAANGLGARVELSNVPTVYAGRWGDTAVVLNPALFQGKVAVFTMAPAVEARAPALLRCDSVADKFGAAAAAAAESVSRADTATRDGSRGGRGGGFALTPDHRALSAGALAVLIVGLERVPANLVNAAFNGRGSMQPAALPTDAPGAAIISLTAASRLFGRPIQQLAFGARGQPVTTRWSYDWHLTDYPARNVIAMLPGSDPARAGEYVLVGAHSDHNGVNPIAVDHDSLRAVNTVTRRQGSNDPVCRPTVSQQHQIDSLISRARGLRAPRKDSIMNGADDDGSGTALLLEIAERFAAEKPARSIIFISHQGEESGLLGSRWFTDHPTIPLASIAAALNMDMVGKGRAEEVMFGGPSSVQMLGSRRLSREFGDIIDSVNASRAETMAIDRTWDIPANPMNRFCRSDQVNYVHHGVPVTYFSLGYTQDYHQVTDEAQYIDYDHAARLGRFIYDIMWAIAKRRDRPAISGADPGYPRCR